MSASSKRLSFVGALISAAALPLLVTGCTITPTVSADSVAEAAADALENEVGQRPTIDCGDGSIPLKEGTEVTCDLIDDATGDIYDTSVTLSNIKDGRYQVAVKVADHKRADN